MGKPAHDAVEEACRLLSAFDIWPKVFGANNPTRIEFLDEIKSGAGRCCASILIRVLLRPPPCLSQSPNERMEQSDVAGPFDADFIRLLVA
jgi:hypothetical protein